MERTPSGRAGSRAREIEQARRRGGRWPGALVVPVVAVLCLGFPGAARVASAQQSATIRVSATVSSGYASAGIREASAPAAEAEPARHLQRIPVAGVGVLEVEGAAGARVWLSWAGPGPSAPDAVTAPGASPAPAGDRDPRLLRATVAWPGL